MATLTISLPNQILERINSETKAKGFATRSEFFRTLLRKYFATETEFEIFSPQPLGKIRRQLEMTGKYNQKFIDSVIIGLSESSVYAN